MSGSPTTTIRPGSEACGWSRSTSSPAPGQQCPAAATHRTCQEPGAPPARLIVASAPLRLLRQASVTVWCGLRPCQGSQAQHPAPQLHPLVSPSDPWEPIKSIFTGLCASHPRPHPPAPKSCWAMVTNCPWGRRVAVGGDTEEW